MLTPQPPPPQMLVGKHLFYWFSGHSWVSLTLVDWRQQNDVIASPDSLWRRLPHNGSQKKLAAKSRFGDWPQWPHASRPFMGPIFGRNHSQVYPHNACQIWSWSVQQFGRLYLTDRQTHTHTHTHRQNLYYIDIDRWIFSEENIIVDRYVTLNTYIGGIILVDFYWAVPEFFFSGFPHHLGSPELFWISCLQTFHIDLYCSEFIILNMIQIILNETNFINS